MRDASTAHVENGAVVVARSVAEAWSRYFFPQQDDLLLFCLPFAPQCNWGCMVDQHDAPPCQSDVELVLCSVRKFWPMPARGAKLVNYLN